MNIYQKILAVQSEVGYVEKEGYNEHFKFKFVKEESLLNAVKPLLVKHGLLIIPSAGTIVQTGTLTQVQMEFAIYDAESGESVKITWAGSGSDSQDKGLYKAFTGGVKTFLAKTFLVATGDDPEMADKAKKQAPKAPDKPRSRAELILASVHSIKNMKTIANLIQTRNKVEKDPAYTVEERSQLLQAVGDRIGELQD